MSQTLSKESQAAFAAFIATIAPLAAAGIPIVSRRDKVPANDVEAQLQRVGLCIYVFPGLPVRVNQNNPGPYVDGLELRARVMENPELNNTELDAYDVAEHILANAHLHCLTIDGSERNPLICRPTPIIEVPDPDEVVFDIPFDLGIGIALRAAT